MLAATLAGGVLLVLDVAVGSWFALPAALMALLLLLALWYLLPLPLLQHVHAKPDEDDNHARGNRDAD